MSSESSSPGSLAGAGPAPNAVMGAPEAGRPSWKALAVAGSLFFLITVAGLTWAKWEPYAFKAAHVLSAHSFGGTSILTGKAKVPPAPSWHAAWSFTVTYFKAIWIALVAALVIASAAEALIPRRWLVRQLSRGPRRLGGAAAGGLAALPSMMCTCCSAPLAVTLRRRGVPAQSALAYWVGNPSLNPAVLLFLAVVLPWQWVAVRIAGGIALVLLVGAVIGRLDRSRWVSATLVGEGLPGGRGPEEPFGWAPVARRFALALGRLAVTLLPEYLLVVLLVGGLRGWLFPLGHGVAGWGALAVLIFAVAGALFVIPTAGEIPIILGLLAAGVGAGPAGALLITLPAVSLPSIAMMSRSFSARTLAAVLGAVVAVGLAAGGVLAATGT